jgi:hypothetical protein
VPGGRRNRTGSGPKNRAIQATVAGVPPEPPEGWSDEHKQTWRELSEAVVSNRSYGPENLSAFRALVGAVIARDELEDDAGTTLRARTYATASVWLGAFNLLPVNRGTAAAQGMVPRARAGSGASDGSDVACASEAEYTGAMKMWQAACAHIEACRIADDPDVFIPLPRMPSRPEAR